MITRNRVEPRRTRRAAVIAEFVMQRSRTVQLLDAELGLDVVHVGATLRSLMSWLQRTDKTRWPHLLIVDLPAGDTSSRELEILAALRDAGMKVLILSALRARSMARQVASLGVEGIVSTADSEEQFVRAAEDALTGIVTITPRAQAVIYGSTDALKLSRQEERALALYASGLTIAEVAAHIGVRQDTARKYLQRVRDKFTLAGRPARTKLELAHIAWSEGYAVSAAG